MTGQLHKILNKYGLCGKFVRRRPLLYKKKMTAWFSFVKLHLATNHKTSATLSFGQTRPKQRYLSNNLMSSLETEPGLAKNKLHINTNLKWFPAPSVKE